MNSFENSVTTKQFNKTLKEYNLEKKFIKRLSMKYKSKNGFIENFEQFIYFLPYL